MENEVQLQTLVKKLLNIYNAYKWSKSKLNLRKKKHLTKTKKGEIRFKETSEVDTEIETRCHQRNIFVFTQTLPDCRKLKSYLTDPRKTKSSFSLLKEYSSHSSTTDFRSDSSYQWVCRCDSYASLQTYGKYHSVNVCTCPNCCCKAKKKYGTVNQKSITEIKGVKNTKIAIIPRSLERLDETTITNADETKEVQVPPEYPASPSGILIKPYETQRSASRLRCDCKCEHRRSVACQNSPGYCRVCSTITFVDSSTPDSISTRKSPPESSSTSTCSCPCDAPPTVKKFGNCKCCITENIKSCRQACVQTTGKTCCCGNSERKNSVGTEIQRDKILVPTQYADEPEPSQNISLVLSDVVEKELMPEKYRNELPSNGEKYKSNITEDSRLKENGDRPDTFLNGDRHKQNSTLDARSKEKVLNGDRQRSNMILEPQAPNSKEKILNGDRLRSNVAMESRSKEKISNGDRLRSDIAMESRSDRIPSDTFNTGGSIEIPSGSTTQRTVEAEERPFWADLPKDFFLNLKSCECTCPRCLGLEKLTATQTTNMLFENKIKNYYAELSQCLRQFPNNSLHGYPLQNKPSEIGTIDEGVNTFNNVVVQTYTSATFQPSAMQVGGCRQVNECCTCEKNLQVENFGQSRMSVGACRQVNECCACGKNLQVENIAPSRVAMSQMNMSTQRLASQFAFNDTGRQGQPYDSFCCCDDIFPGLAVNLDETDPFPGLNEATKDEIRDLLKSMEETLSKESGLHRKNLTGIMKQLTKQAGEIKELKVHIKGVLQSRKILTCKDVQKKLRKLEETKKKEEKQRREKMKRKQRMEKERAKKEKEREKLKKYQTDSCCKCEKEKNLGCCGQCCANRCCGCCGTCCGGCCANLCDCCCTPCERTCPCCCDCAECCDNCWSCGCFQSRDRVQTRSHKCKCR